MKVVSWSEFLLEKASDGSTKSHETAPKHFFVILGFGVVSCDLVDRSCSSLR